MKKKKTKGLERLAKQNKAGMLGELTSWITRPLDPNKKWKELIQQQKDLFQHGAEIIKSVPGMYDLERIIYDIPGTGNPIPHITYSKTVDGVKFSAEAEPHILNVRTADIEHDQIILDEKKTLRAVMRLWNPLIYVRIHHEDPESFANSSLVNWNPVLTNKFQQIAPVVETNTQGRITVSTRYVND